MPTLDNLRAILADAIADAPLDAGFRAAMESALIKGHTAAYLAAVAEKTGVGVDSGLFKGLSKAERADIRQAVAAQLGYLAGFDPATMSEAAARARAAMYAGSIGATYEKARAPGLPFYPGEGTECLTNCRCHWDDNGDGTYSWILTAKESCPTCEERAAANPYEVNNG